ncbi:MAG: aldo/keto reductase [Ktedonobacteraceae bacterium]|nr:aldo/keto reductase [Ktedonobacteraceae bacterium]
MTASMTRTLGRSGIAVSALGMGCWAIGGPFLMDGLPDGWGEIDDAESIRAIQRAIELGVTFFDTADAYGTGHSERILGQAIKGQRDKVIVATKFGYTYDEVQRALTGKNTTPQYIRQACEASLHRLQTDYIDLYQLHVGDVPPEQTGDIWATLDQLKQEGLIRAYGWSTGDPEGAHLLATQTSGTTIQHQANVLLDAPEIFTICAQHNLASINNGPLAMGFLSGKFDASSRLPTSDVRGSGHTWVTYFTDGKPRPEFLEKLAAVREILQSDGRTLVQGALAWLWARSEQTIPIPGFKSVQQVEENARAMQFGPLTADQVQEIETLLSQQNQLTL